MRKYKKKLIQSHAFVLRIFLTAGLLLACTTAAVSGNPKYRELGTAGYNKPVVLNNLQDSHASVPGVRKIQVSHRSGQQTPANYTPALLKKFDKPDLQSTRQAYIFKSAREKQSLAGVWKFKYLPAAQSDAELNFYKTAYTANAWQDISVPGHWEVQGVASPGFKEAQPGTGLYRTTFDVAGERLDGNTFIVFEGVYYEYQLWINEEPVGSWDSPYNRAMFDISRHIKAGTNLLAVKVSARAQGTNLDAYENWALAGIFRDVYLYFLPVIYIQDLGLTTVLENQKLASLEFDVELASTITNINWRRIKVSGALHDPDGRLVQKFDLSRKIEQVQISQNAGQRSGETPAAAGEAGKPVPGGQGLGGHAGGSSETGKTAAVAEPLTATLPEESLPIGLGEGVELAQANFPGLKAGRLTGLLKIKNPRLWTAETPYLYTLSLTVKYSNKTMQEGTEKLGIRQVKVDKSVVRLNGQPIKLRGVNWLELYPDTGKVLSEQQLVNDLQLLKAAHINFIRTTYCPPQSRFLELTDEWGFYVMSDLPLGLTDAQAAPAYAGELGKRVRATMRRDRNRASLLFWSLGHEQELTPLFIELGRYVKEYDASRLICYPQKDMSLTEQQALLPDYVDLLAPHYPRVASIKEHLNQALTRPLVYTAYADALGLAADRMASLWEQMYRNPAIAGGAVWRFADLGLKRRAVGKIDPVQETYAVWPDPATYYDQQGLAGGDGIVYADRVPQSDYWQVQAVYNPVRILEPKQTVKTGEQELIFTLENRYDFLDLSAFKLRWELYEERRPLQSGVWTLACPPHQSCQTRVSLRIPDDPAQKFYWFKLYVNDRENRPVGEQIVRFLPESGKMQLSNRLAKALSPGKVGLVQNANATSTVNIDANGNYRLLFNQATGTIQLQTKSGVSLIKDGPFARVGRKLCMAEQTAVGAQKMEVWQPALLQEPFIVLAKEITQNKAGVRIRTDYWYERPDVPAGSQEQSLEGGVRFIVTPQGWIEVLYNYKTNNATGTLLEAGLSFILPETLTEFYWIGRGPYPSYPGKEELAPFGFYHHNINDLHFQGNRSVVLLAAFTDGQGNGFALLGDWAINLSLEKSAAGLILSYNALLSGRGNREQEPEIEVKAGQVGWITGNFKILPFNGKFWQQGLSGLFGESDSKAEAFQPYFHSYDQ